MNGSTRVQRALPAVFLVLVVLLDLVAGRRQTVVGLVVMAPLVAASFLGRRATATYGVLALVVAAVLGVYDRQYTPEALPFHLARLLLTALAGLVAMAACTMRLRREDQLARVRAEAAAARAVVETAETLQRHLLGDPPDVAPLEAAVRYVPAGRHAQVGGDWYDAFRLGNGTTMLAIGDVTGHDAPAAALMAQTRGMLRGLAQTGPRTPSAVLTALDGAFADLGVATPVTVVVATLDLRPDGGALLRWSNAGHPPPVLVRADGRALLLERPVDPLLGVVRTARRDDHEVALDPGDTLVLYTDGLVERRDAPLDDGFAGLVATLERIGHEPLERVCDTVLRELGGREDDVALLAVRLPPARQGRPPRSGGGPGRRPPPPSAPRPASSTASRTWPPGATPTSRPAPMRGGGTGSSGSGARTGRPPAVGWDQHRFTLEAARSAAVPRRAL
ncbi:PP2C family protein-serine/threonine phosphatase [Geodermatophilus sp. SYSU D00703]